MLFTVTGGAASTAYGITLGGFDSGITVGGTNEYVIHVVNPDLRRTLTTALTATITSPLTSSGGHHQVRPRHLDPHGRPTPQAAASNKTTINEGILEIADLDNIGGNTGGLVFAGGTLRLGAGSHR